jgi:diguanylate cyclase (GGDEF)-like protein
MRLPSELKPARSYNKTEFSPLDAAILGCSLDASSLSPKGAAEPSFRKEADTNETVFQTRLADANQEFANLLRDVQTISYGTFAGKTTGPPLSELLMRAVRCATKQYMLQAELGSLALRDELTGSYNRRGFMAIAERQLKLGRRCGKGMLLFFLDVDGLKQINDSFGHREGDRVLKRVSEALLKTFRDSDVVARLGGDEFAVLAIEASGQGEDKIRERLRKYLKSKGGEDSRYAISVSVGATRYDPRKSPSLEELMAQADRSMYAQKKSKSMRETEFRNELSGLS